MIYSYYYSTEDPNVYLVLNKKDYKLTKWAYGMIGFTWGLLVGVGLGILKLEGVI